jgi:hypothetical protein
MKIRNGHVSNSSSSSFLLAVTKEVHEEVRERMHPYIIAVIDELSTSDNIFGQEVVKFESWCTPGSDSYEYKSVDYEGEIPPDQYGDEMYMSSAFEEYAEEVKKYKDCYYENSIDFE